MERAQLLALYDQDQRADIVYANVTREALPNVVRHLNRIVPYGYIVYSRLDADTADAEIERQMADFEEMERGMEWKVYAHDDPPDLKARLAARGFTIEEADAIMVLDLHNAPEVLRRPVSPAVRRISDPDDIRKMLQVQHVVWNRDFEFLVRELVDELREMPDTLCIYAAYVDDVPVSSAWVRFPENSQFGSLWGGSTLPEHRGQGHYTALLAVRVQEAMARGVRFLTVDASPMSRPILEKQGFEVITYAWECKWPDGDS